VVDRGRGEDVVARDHAPEVGIARHLETDAARAAGLVDDREQRDRVGRRIPRQHALREAAAAQQVLAPPLGGERVLGGEHGGCRDGAGAREELPSGVHTRTTTRRVDRRCA
jgi:hypothetical protein